MSDLAAAGEPVHSGAESVEPVWRAAIGWVAGVTEKDHEQAHFVWRRCNDQANTRTNGG
jgi:hypothetical protein